MVSYDDCPALFEEGLAEALSADQRGLCCDLTDAFARALGLAEYHTVTLHARGVGMRKLRLLGLQGDVLRALCLSTGSIVLIPLCSVYAFYEGALLPSTGGEEACLRLDGGSGRRGCAGLVPELERLIGKHVSLVLPEAQGELLVTEVIGLTLRAVSGETIVTLRIDCVDALELPPEGEPPTEPDEA
jgi:hypothetical protein